MKPLGLTAFPEMEAELRLRLARAPVRVDSFTRKIARCSTASCLGMCCYDGIYLSRDEPEVLREVSVRHAEFFASIGVALPAEVAAEKTATRARPFSVLVEGFPAHFKDTACVFLTGDGLCSLQMLSESLGLHPWFYKPAGCWLHPLALSDADGPAILLDSRETDPFRDAGYDGYVDSTHCGRTCQSGNPGWEVLSTELAFLGRIIGRDLADEILSHSRAGLAT